MSSVVHVEYREGDRIVVVAEDLDQAELSKLQIDLRKLLASEKEILITANYDMNVLVFRKEKDTEGV